MQAQSNVSYDKYIDIHIFPNTPRFDLLTLTQHLLALDIFADKDVRLDRSNSDVPVSTLLIIIFVISEIYFHL